MAKALGGRFDSAGACCGCGSWIRREKWSLEGLRVMEGDVHPDRNPEKKPLEVTHLVNHSINTTNKVFLQGFAPLASKLPLNCGIHI